MTIKQTLIWANKKLKHLARAGHYDTPTLDAEILLAFALKKPKEFLYAHSEKKLITRQWNQFKKLIARRAKHEPIAYITGHKYFYGLDFFVNKNVMIPRPETETLVEETIKKIQNIKYKIQNTLITDVGTGSGCIIISLAKSLLFPSNLFWSDRTKTGYAKKIKFFATEISPAAFKVARKNARRHKVAITFLRGNLLEPVLPFLTRGKPRCSNIIITANLPYLTTKQWQDAQPEIKKYEPRLALDGGPDGLKYHRKLFKQLSALSADRRPSAISVLLEIDPSQTKSVTKLIKKYFNTSRFGSLLRFCEIKKDLAGRDRVIIFHIQNN